jgi:HD-GYP domain-containing protein (c-di-GMP phosphodiesterase class II)
MRASVMAIASMVEVWDGNIAGHQRRVADISAAVATELGQDPDVIMGVWLAAHIHDLGKIGVPVEILNRQARLSPAEFTLIKEHPQIGHDIVAKVAFPWPIADIILQHHERLDGSGYPAGLRGDEILLGAKIIAVAEIVDAIEGHDQHGSDALGPDAAVTAIRACRGTIFDPDVVDAYLHIFNRRDHPSH